MSVRLHFITQPTVAYMCQPSDTYYCALRGFQESCFIRVVTAHWVGFTAIILPRYASVQTEPMASE